MEEFGQGLTLSGAGILITFLALGLLIFTIWILKVLFPASRTGENQDVGSGKVGTDDMDQLRRKAAAAGVAVLLERRKTTRQGSLGKLLEHQPGAWWHKGLNRVQGKEKG